MGFWVLEISYLLRKYARMGGAWANVGREGVARHPCAGSVGRTGACDRRSPGLRCIPVRIRRVGRPVRVRSMIVRCDVTSTRTERMRFGIDPTERSSDAFQLIRREAGNPKPDRRTGAAIGLVQLLASSSDYSSISGLFSRSLHSGLQPPCLRFAVAVTGTPRKTRYAAAR